MRRFEKSPLPFLLVLLAVGLMACAPADAARALKENLVNPNGPALAVHAFRNAAADHSSPVPADLGSEPLVDSEPAVKSKPFVDPEPAMGSEPSVGPGGEAAVASEPSIDPVFEPAMGCEDISPDNGGDDAERGDDTPDSTAPAPAANGGGEQTDNEPAGADSSAPSPAANGGEQTGDEPAGAASSAPVPNDHGPYLLGTDPAGEEQGPLPVVYVPQPGEEAPGEEAAAGSQGAPPMPDGADFSAPPVPSARLRSNDQVPQMAKDHGPNLMPTDPVAAAGISSLYPAADIPSLFSAGAPAATAAAAAAAAGGDHSDGYDVEGGVESVGCEEMPADNGGDGAVGDEPKGADSSAAPVPSAWLKPAQIPVENGEDSDEQTGHEQTGDEQSADESVGTEFSAAPVPSAWLKPAQIPVENGEDSDEQTGHEQTGDEQSADESVGTEFSAAPVPSAWLKPAQIPVENGETVDEQTGEEQSADEPVGAGFSAPPVPSAWLRSNDQGPQMPNGHGPYLLGSDAMPADGSEEEALAHDEHGPAP
ncbi:hypothetical protein CLOM_g18554 [Closterium sp. NIES-68]|nr:hypothetical protein CLOM_g18554 [Closterium sp. NIES-68]GJP60064.1 hypothetical protein CLOP_g17205 [Closterium sp. NIES-67]